MHTDTNYWGSGGPPWLSAQGQWGSAVAQCPRAVGVRRGSVLKGSGGPLWPSAEGQCGSAAAQCQREVGNRCGWLSAKGQWGSAVAQCSPGPTYIKTPRLLTSGREREVGGEYAMAFYNEALYVRAAGDGA